ITIAVKYPGSPVHSWFLDPLGQRVVIGLGLGTATLLLIKSPLGEASGAHMNPAITLTFFYLGKIRLVDLCFYIIAQVTGIFATLFVLSRLFPEPVMHPTVNYLISMSGSAGGLAAFAGEFLIAFLLMATVLWINNTPYWARHTPWCVALLVTFFVTVESPLSGANMDPALATISDFFGRALARLVALLRGASPGDAGGAISLPRTGAPGLLRQTFPLHPPPLHLPVRVSGLAGRRTD